MDGSQTLEIFIFISFLFYSILFHQILWPVYGYIICEDTQMDKLPVDSTVIIELNGNEDNWLMQQISSVVLYIGNQTYKAHLMQQIPSEI